MRIALIHPYSWPRVRRGGERYLHDLGWYLARSGHDVEILTGADGGDGDPDEIQGVRVRRTWRRGPRARRSPWHPDVVERDAEEARRLVADGGYDLAHTLWPAAVAGVRDAGTPVVYTLLGLANRWLRSRPRMWSVHRQALRQADVAAGLSATAVAGILDATGREAVELPPGVRTDLFEPRLDARRPPHAILFSAALDASAKGLHRLLAAMPRILDAHPDATLRLSGSGDAGWAWEELPRRVRRRVRAATDVLGVGDVDEVPARYAAATVTALPSRGEAFGLAVVESLASGTPVVASAGTGPAEIVPGPPVGVLVDPADPAELAAAVVAAVECAEDPATPERCAAHARRWDWDEVVGPRHTDLYRRLV